MANLILFALGFGIACLMMERPIKFSVHHTHETVLNTKTEKELEELQEKMLKDDPKNDKLYEEIDSLTAEINDIMGGSDRNG